jgi:NAD(P)-dependent dehydrogenase (short-subunit alcohol dehydrogenase family)
MRARRISAGGIAQPFLVGGAMGAAVAAGHALLLYTGGGFLRAAGFLMAVTLASVAAGLWTGGASRARPAPRSRWTWTMAAFGVAGIFAAVWSINAPLRDAAWGGALAVLLVLAEPAYAAGLLLAGLGDRPGAQAPLAVAGAALGIVLAATLFIPRADASAVYLGAAAAVVVAGVFPARATGSTDDERTAMNGKVAIITGVGARGQLGYAIADRFLSAGAHVIVSGRDAGVTTLADELAHMGRPVHAVVADLMSDADVARLMDAAREKFGRLDALVNVAGGLSVTKPLAHTSPEEWRREIERNAETVLRVSTAALPLLRQAGGAIINFASPAGLRAVKSLGAYSAAKAAVIAITRAMALEERAQHVRVNAIAPGMIDTEQNRKSAGDPDTMKYVTREEIADVALFLASEAASGISGETVHVPGEGLR